MGHPVSWGRRGRIAWRLLFGPNLADPRRTPHTAFHAETLATADRAAGPWAADGKCCLGARGRIGRKTRIGVRDRHRTPSRQNTRLSEEAVRENPALRYDLASDSPVAAEGAAAGTEAATSFFEGTSYSSKVLQQMEAGAGEFHSFPESVSAFENAGTVRTIVGGDGQVYQMLEIPGVLRHQQRQMVGWHVPVHEGLERDHKSPTVRTRRAIGIMSAVEDFQC